MPAILLLGVAVLAATPAALWVSYLVLAKLLTLARLDQEGSGNHPWHERRS